MHSIASTPRAVRAFFLALVLSAAACGGDGTGPTPPPPPPPPPPPDSLVVQATGRIERGATVQFSATRNGSPANVTWSAEPAAAVQWEAAGRARLLTTGAVRIVATMEGGRGSAVVQVNAPPSVAFERVVDGQRDIWRVALDGGDLMRLSTHAAEDAWPSSAQGDVYFVSYRVAPAAVFAVPAAGGTEARVTTVTGEYQDAAISPDGSRLAFIRTVGGVGRLFVSDRSGANAVRVVAAGGATIEAAPAWSADGSRIVFVSTASGNADIWVAPAAGGAAQRVAATNAAEVEPAFSPDGQRIVFVRATNDGTDLWSVAIASGQERQLTSRPGVEARPAWLADGRIVFTITEPTGRRLHWLDHDQPQTIHPVSQTVLVEGHPTPIR